MFTWKLNTSNQGKYQEFLSLFSNQGIALEATHIDLEEIEADPLQVIAHKASQLEENVLVEDSSLEIEGANVGIQIRWLLDHLSTFVGRKAEWNVLLAFHRAGEVWIYKGSVIGTIVSPRGKGGFGFDPIFLPEGATKTLAEAKPLEYNARATAVHALLKGNCWCKHPLLKEWDGPWQNH